MGKSSGGLSLEYKLARAACSLQPRLGLLGPAAEVGDLHSRPAVVERHIVLAEVDQVVRPTEKSA